MININYDSVNKFHGNRNNETNSLSEKKSLELYIIQNQLMNIKKDNLENEKNLDQVKEIERKTKNKYILMNSKLKSILFENKNLLNEYLLKRIQLVRLLHNKQLKKESQNLDNIIKLYMETRIQYEGCLSIVY